MGRQGHEEHAECAGHDQQRPRRRRRQHLPEPLGRSDGHVDVGWRVVQGLRLADMATGEAGDDA